MMPTETHLFSSKKALWVGYIMAAVPVLLLTSGVMKVTTTPVATEGFVHLGYPDTMALGIGIVELLRVVLYLIPQTAVMGEILLTGYLGGATASHVRIGEPFHMAVLMGIPVWSSLYLRDARIRTLIPLRQL